MDELGIEAFLAVVRNGSLTEAANSLFMAQSTLTHRIAQLEKEVGINLIERGRGHKSLSLTASGKKFLSLAKRWEDLVQETKQLRTCTKNYTLVIGALDSISAGILPPIYNMMSDHLQNMTIRIRTHGSTELYLLLDRGEIDVAFPALELPMPNLIIQKFFSEPMVLIRKEEPSSYKNEIIDLHSLDQSNELFIDWGPPFRAWYDRCRGEKGYPSIQIDSSQLLLTFMNNNGKWAIVPMSMARMLAMFLLFHYTN